MKLVMIVLLSGLISGFFSIVASADDAEKALGKYLIQVGGCNDCHTAGYAPSGGTTPESEWLAGSSIGYKGPWGTTYASNLRMIASELNEAQWLELVRAPMRPPMPTPSLAAMSDYDLSVIYRYINSLGVAGVSAPSYVAPGDAVTTMYFDFVPKAP